MRNILAAVASALLLSGCTAPTHQAIDGGATTAAPAGASSPADGLPPTAQATASEVWKTTTKDGDVLVTPIFYLRGGIFSGPNELLQVPDARTLWLNLTVNLATSSEIVVHYYTPGCTSQCYVKVHTTGQKAQVRLDNVTGGGREIQFYTEGDYLSWPPTPSIPPANYGTYHLEITALVADPVTPSRPE
jgi:hypothetical protein